MAAQMEQGPRKLFDITTLTGEIDVNAKRKAVNFCDSMEPWID
jgi:hypothetical protein